MTCRWAAPLLLFLLACARDTVHSCAATIAHVALATKIEALASYSLLFLARGVTWNGGSSWRSSRSIRLCRSR